jgi:hypothetical protein
MRRQLKRSPLVHAAESVDRDLLDQQFLDHFGLHHLFFDQSFCRHLSSPDFTILTAMVTAAKPSRDRLLT